MDSELQLLLGPLTNKSYLLDEVFRFDPQWRQYYPKNAPEEHQFIWLKKMQQREIGGFEKNVGEYFDCSPLL